MFPLQVDLVFCVELLDFKPKHRELIFGYETKL